MRAAIRLVPVLLLGLAAAGVVGAQSEDAFRETYERGVVRLHVTYQLWDEDRPWAKQQPKSRTASAVVVGDGLLLTSADILEHATLIQFAAFGRIRPGEPRPVHVDPNINLALLAIDDPAALEGLVAVPVADETPEPRTRRRTCCPRYWSARTTRR